jgi:hypothetical protein
MIVARQFIAWTCRETSPSRRDGMIRSASSSLESWGGHRARVPNSHRSLRDGSYPAIFQGINCLATIIRSLRDKSTPLPFASHASQPYLRKSVFICGWFFVSSGSDLAAAPARIGRYGPSGRWKFARRLAGLRRGAGNRGSRRSMLCCRRRRGSGTYRRC